MPTFFIEDHAVDRYRERVRNCSYQEAYNYIRDSVHSGAWMKRGAGGRQGGMQMRLSDCVLVIKKDFRDRFDYAVATVLGPSETEESVVSADSDDEMVRLNAMADASRRAPVEALPDVAPGIDKDFAVPASLGEAKERREKLVWQLGDKNSTLTSIQEIEYELTRLNAWMKAENKRIAADLKSGADAKREAKKRKSNG